MSMHMNPDKKKKTKRVVVTKTGSDGVAVDCRLASSVELGFSYKLESGFIPDCTTTGKRGLLVKCTPDKPEPTMFATEAGADRSITKTKEGIELVRRSMADEMPKLAPLLEPGTFSLRHEIVYVLVKPKVLAAL